MKMKQESTNNLLIRIGRFYWEGFRALDLGKTLWLIILIKLFILFFVLKLFFFPDFLGHLETEADKAEYVSNELYQRANY